MALLELPHALLSSMREGKVVLFLGAGAAIGAAHPGGAAIPLGQQLADMLAAQFLGAEYTGKPLPLVAELAINESDLNTVQEFIATKFRLFDPAPFHLTMAQLPWRAIFTTNYDLIVERAYEKPNAVQELVPFIHDGQRVDERLTSKRSVHYVKLHGCISIANDPSLPLILTTEQYITHRDRRRRLFERLGELERCDANQRSKDDTRATRARREEGHGVGL